MRRSGKLSVAEGARIQRDVAMEDLVLIADVAERVEVEVELCARLERRGLSAGDDDPIAADARIARHRQIELGQALEQGIRVERHLPHAARDSRGSRATVPWR